EEAFAVLNQAVAADSGQPLALFYLGILHDRVGNDDEAIESYQRSLQRYPATVGGLMNLGRPNSQHSLGFGHPQPFQLAAGDCQPDQTGLIEFRVVGRLSCFSVIGCQLGRLCRDNVAGRSGGRLV
ncbi:MAG: tetratricopeptide repeat protein, partial [Planctomycetia bacterium]|nr:tetratricopeptide repeat protein [Planctomycetia bacterium]